MASKGFRSRNTEGTDKEIRNSAKAVRDAVSKFGMNSAEHQAALEKHQNLTRREEG